MNDRTKNLLNHITDTLKKQPDVPVEHAIQAVLLTAKQMGFDNRETGWVLDMLRVELGIGSKRWSVLVLAVLQSIPQERGEKPLLY